jgi:hypothetical protein
MKLFCRTLRTLFSTHFAPMLAGLAIAIFAQSAQAQESAVAEAEAEAPAKSSQTESEAIAESGSIAKSGSNWIQLFNGKDLTGWTPKIRGHKLGDNYADTFRVVDGKLVVSYDKYTEKDFMSLDPGKSSKPDFNKFGHLFYKDSFSHYVLRAEYRFVGKQVKNGPGWAKRNNGLMLHGQDPATMDVDQKFPVSIEVQLLGGRGNGQPISTLNLCTPGTNVVMDGKLFKPHCTSSSSDTYEGDQWVAVEVEVRGSDVIRHRVEGETVLEYTQPQYDPNDKQFKIDSMIKGDSLLIDRGTISIQAESAPIEFRKIELRVLDK